MKNITVQAQSRPLGSRNSVRRLRRLENRVPAILYGGEESSIPLSLPGDSTNRLAQDEAFYTHILKLVIDETECSVVVKDVQRHPYKRKVIHVDFLRVLENRQLTMQVPVHILNESTAAGVRAGGIVNHLLNELEIRCLPKDIPESIEVDIADLEIERTLHLSDISLPEGVELLHALGEGNDPGIVAIHKPRAEIIATEEEVAPAEGEVAAEPEAPAE